MRRPVVVLSLLAAACSARVEPTNPYDPATPPDRQARAVVRGALAAPTLASPGGLTVFLRANHQIVKQVQTAGDGAFLLDEIVPGSYAVEAAPQGFVPVTIPVALAPGQDLELGALTLTPLLGVDAAIVTGQVTLESRTFHGGTLIEAVGRGFTAITDSSGAFRHELSEGTYDLRMTHEAFTTVEVNALAVSRGEQRTLAPVQLAGNPATIEATCWPSCRREGRGRSRTRSSRSRERSTPGSPTRTATSSSPEWGSSTRRLRPASGRWRTRRRSCSGRCRTSAASSW